jgi:hypothetical protein
MTFIWIYEHTNKTRQLCWSCSKSHPLDRYTAWFKKMDSISYVYISWIIRGMWIVYITFERGDPKFSNTTARALAYRTAVQQRQLRAKWLLCSTRFFALKLSRRMLCSVRFVFVSTFSCGIWKFRTSSFKYYVDHPHTIEKIEAFL